MSQSNSFLLASLPTSISQTKDKNEALQALKSTVGNDNSSVNSFNIPAFKIGSLDALVQQADDLAKLSTTCEAVVNKIGDALRSILGGSEDKLAQQKTINDKPVEHYLHSFQWNKVKYRADKPITELVGSLQNEIIAIDNDVKVKFSQHNQVKTNLSASQRRQTVLVRDSEYLETQLVVVPNPLTKEFLKSYETLTQMVVPRSSVQVAADDEFTLYAVTVFKKFAQEFVHKSREKRWIPRDFKYSQGGKDEEAKEVASLANEERKLWGEALRLGRTGYSESAMIWIHVLALRVFVETVLRYGLPLDFISALIQTNSRAIKKIRTNMDSKYSYLGGNAFGKDKRGRVKKDDSALQADLQAANQLGNEEYMPYVCYHFEFL